MHYFTIDHLIVYASFLLTLVVGLRAGRGIKTIKEYVLGNKIFGTTSLVLTYLATNLSAETVIRIVSMIFSDGIITSVALLGLVLGDIIQALFIVPHAVHFRNCMTMGDMMVQLYGKTSGVIAGSLGLLNAIFLSGLDFVALGILCKSLLGIPAPTAILVVGGILTLYSAHGGIKSVVTTDILQFLMAAVGIPLIAYMAVHQAGGMTTLLSKVPQEKWMIMEHPKCYFYLTLFLLWSIFPAGLIDSAIIQRLLMGKTKKQLRNQYLMVALFDPLFQLIVTLMALAGLVLYPDGEGNGIVTRMIQDFFPVGFKGLAATGLLAMVMSTIDSYLHVTGVTLVHDVIKPIYVQWGKSLSASQEKTCAQGATVLVGIIAITIGLHTTDMFGLLLDALESTAPMLMFPLLSGMMGLKPEKKAFYIAAVVTAVAWVACKLCLPGAYGYLSTLLCIVANGVAFFGTHLYINRGFKKVVRSDIQYLSNYTRTKPFFHGFTLKNCLAYLQKCIQKGTFHYVVAGIFCLLNVTLPYFLCDDIIQLRMNRLALTHCMGGIFCVLLIAKEKFLPSLHNKGMSIIFYMTLLYCLPFTGTVMCVISQGDNGWLFNLLISLALLVGLVEWGMFLLLTGLGIGLGLFFYPYYGSISCWECHTTIFAMYQLLLVCSMGILFVYSKEKKSQQTANAYQQLMLHHSLLEADYLHKLQYQALQKQQLELQKEPLATAKEGLRFLARLMPLERSLSQRGLEQLDAFVNYYKTSFYHTMDAMRLKLSTCSLEALLVRINLALNDADLVQRVTIQRLTAQKSITCDVEKVAQLLANCLKVLGKQIPPEWTIQLTIQDTELCYRLQVVTMQRECLRKLPALAFMFSPQGAQPLLQNTFVQNGSAQGAQPLSQKAFVETEGPQGPQALLQHTFVQNGSAQGPSWTTLIEHGAVPIQSSYMGTAIPIPLAVPKTAIELPERNQAQIIEAHYGYHEEKNPQGGGCHEGKKPQGGGGYKLIVLPVSVDAIRSAIVDKDPLPKDLPLDTPESLKTEQAFLDQLAESFCVLDETIAQDAIAMIKHAHQGQWRKSGEPFYTHPLQVAMIVLRMTKDADAVLAALLHDVVEDTAIHIDQIAYQYGQRVAYLVQTLTHLDPTGKKTKLTEQENHEQLTAAENKELLLIKLADRLHNMRTIRFHKPEKQRHIAQETLDFYLPLLGRNVRSEGIAMVLEELKNICEKVLGV